MKMQENKQEEIKTVNEENKSFPNLPEELRKKLDNMKIKLEEFSKDIVKNNKEVMAVALLPPTRITKEDEKELTKDELEKLRNRINLLVIPDLEDEKEWHEIRERIIKYVNKKALEIDPNIFPTIIDFYEIRENCYDAKYELLQMITAGAILYDANDFLAAVKICEVHKAMVLNKFDKYIVSYVGVGSLFRGNAKSHDIDVYIVIDDTDVKKMTRAELRDRLTAIIRDMGLQASQQTGVKKAFHIQTYILTDFWESIKDANPVIYTFLRDGVPIYDRGVFMPWKLLLKMGRIKPSPEAIDMQMDMGDRLIKRTKGKLIGIMGDDLYYAILNPAQAALMLYGIAPPTPKETIELMEEVFVKKEKLLEKKYVDILSKIRKYYKDIEHGKIKEIKGKDVDELLEDAEDYLKRIKKLFEQIQGRRDKIDLEEMYNSCISIVEDALKINDIKITNKEAVISLFKKYLVDNKKIFPETYYKTLKLVVNTKKNSKNKLASPELHKIMRESRSFVRGVLDYVQRKKGYELERAKLRFKYGNKFGEAILLDKFIYIVKDIDAKEKEIQKANVKEDGSIFNIKDSSLEELEKEIINKEIPPKVFIKEKLFESLKKLFGNDIEILVNY